MNVIKASINDLKEAVDFSYKLQLIESTRCRPLLVGCEQDELYKLFLSYIEREMHDLLLLKEDNILIGVTPIYWMVDDKYVSYSQGPYCSDYDKVSKVFLKYVEENYKGYKFYINTAKEHLESIEFFKCNNFIQLEDAKLMKLEHFNIREFSSKVQLLSNENMSILYSWIDKVIGEDTYWNTERISMHLERFIILGYINSNIEGHIIGRKGGTSSIEIIGFTGSSIVREDLLKAFINHVSDQGLSRIELYTEEENDILLGDQYGFITYDSNVCFIKNL